MTVYELIGVLAKYPPQAEVCVSQKPMGFVVEIKLHDFEDGVVKLYGNGRLTEDGDERYAPREDSGTWLNGS